MRVVVRMGEYLWRPLTDSDADTHFVVQLRNDERFRAMFYNASITPEQHRAFIRAAGERGEINWLIEQDGRPLGVSAIYHFDRVNRKAECGRVVMTMPKLFHLNWVVSACVAFDLLGLNRLYIETLEQNVTIARGVERLGMIREGLHRGHVVREGVSLNVWTFGSTHAEWEDMKPDRLKRFGIPEIVSFEGEKFA